MSEDDLTVPECPSWCDGRHAAFLAVDEGFPDSSDVVTHARSLVELVADSSTHLGKRATVAVDLVREETHPALDDAGLLTGARVVLSLSDTDYVGCLVTPATLRELAVTLTEAATEAERLLAVSQ